MIPPGIGLPPAEVVPSSPILNTSCPIFSSSAVATKGLSKMWFVVKFPAGVRMVRIGGVLSRMIPCSVVFCTFPASSVAVIKSVVLPSGMVDPSPFHSEPFFTSDMCRGAPLLVTAVVVTFVMFVVPSVIENLSCDVSL